LSDKGKIMKKPVALLSLFFTLLPALLWASPPVPFSGKVAINGVNYHGTAKFVFAIRDHSGTVHWRNGVNGQDGITVDVANGRYVVLLGGQGMNPLPASLFANHDELYLRIAFDNNDGQGLRHLAPDQPITAVPYAKVADMVKPGAITTAQLNEQILKYLKPEITLAPQAPGLIFGGQTITLNSRAEGKFLTYQWHKNGQPIARATQDRYVIQGVNKAQHEGNYTLVVTNDFGSVSTQATSLVVDGTPTSHTVASINMDMIFCPPGTFMMGSPTSESGRGTDETQHQVTLTHGFYLGKYEVTQAQYEAVMTGNTNGLNPKPSNWPNNNERPVEQVSWNDIQVFMSRLNEMEQTAGRLPVGWKYVLPTEAQWEYACRAGTTTAYSWGNTIASSNANYNWDGGANDGNDFKQTRDVGQYAANPWGFFDMHGNVWEWTTDWYQAAYPTGNPVIDPTGPASGSARVRRGGSWYSDGTNLRSAKRTSHAPSPRHSDLGFRVGFQAVQPDTANPELELFGGAAITSSAGQAWAEPGVEAHDARDGNLTANVTVTGTVDVNSTGTYVLTYSVADAAGNQASATRTVTVTGARSVNLNASVAMDMLWCPPGTFTMGSPFSEANRSSDETEHNVTLTKGFYLGKYEVTQAQYEAVMTGNANGLSATPSQFAGTPNRPVEKVSWDDAQVFLTRLNAQQAANLPVGWAYVLPTESQWEYACRAGTTTAYSWGNTIASSNSNYNWDGGANDGNDFKQTRDVGQYAANPWGFFDMHGNVREWTADRYQAAYPTGNPVIDPTGPASGSDRVERGGSWSYGSSLALRSAKRSFRTPTFSRSDLGFRVGFQKQ
jgi:formylglycine-generating enzyme required for sulfatase activity